MRWTGILGNVPHHHSGGVDGTTTIFFTPGDSGGPGTVWGAIIYEDVFLPSFFCIAAAAGEAHVSYDISPDPGEFHGIAVHGWNACGSSKQGLGSTCLP